MNRFTLLALLMAAAGAELPGGQPPPLGTCPECGRTTRRRYCTGDENNKHPQRRVVEAG